MASFRVRDLAISTLSLAFGMRGRLGWALSIALATTACDASEGAVGNASDSGPDSTSEAGNGGPDALADADAAVHPDGDAGDPSPCFGVCANAYFGCAHTHPTMDCLQKVCCDLPEDGGPPYLDGSCPTSCSSPDDLGCPGTWYRSAQCSRGSLCCGPWLAGHGSDGG